MKTKQLFFLGIALLGITNATAQNSLQREVDVTRAYEPSVQNSLKLNIRPDMTDTTQMRPDFNYELTPHPLNYGFAVNPLNPARIATIAEAAPLPIYVKLGAGAPLQSVADIRYAKQINSKTDFGAYASHYGNYGKLKNDMEIKETATGTNNRTGVFLDHRTAEDFVISTELGYDFRNVSRYGYYSSTTLPSWFDTSKSSLKQFYHDVKFNFLIGNSFTDRSKFNFNVTGGLDYFADKYKYDQIGWNFGAMFGFNAGYDGFFTVGVETFGNDGMKNISDFSNIVGLAHVAYYFDNGDFRFMMGGKVGIKKYENDLEKEDKTIFLPSLNLEKDLAGGALTPFIDIRSEVTDNSYGALLKRNPYTFSGEYAPHTVGYNGQAGIKGSIGTFKYKVYGGYDVFKDYTYWANIYNYDDLTYGNAFTVLVDDLNVFRAGVEMQANIVNALTLKGGLGYSNYSPDTLDEAGGLPEIQADFSLSYNYRKQLYLTLGMEFTGKRTMFEVENRNYETPLTNDVSSQVSLNFGVDYFFNKQFGVFLNVNNILNRKLYEFNRYRQVGINGMAGVKLTF